ncbi:MAG: ATP-grasp domain-containing protein [Alphaproteobacteria bacterium]|nr:ATP-grasp domain-containing protein [Alphaproteobacteria bacterium]
MGRDPLLRLLLVGNYGLNVAYCCRSWAHPIAAAPPSARIFLGSWRVHHPCPLPSFDGGFPDATSVDAVTALCDRQRVEVVLGVDVGGTKLANAVRRRRPALAYTAAMDDERLDALSDKVRFAGALRRDGLPEPDTEPAEDADRLVALCARRGYPLVVKPAVGEGGFGATILRCDDDMRAYAARARSTWWPLAVQRFLPGAEFSVSAVVHAGEVMGMSVHHWLAPGVLRYAPHPQAEQMARRAIERLGIDGPVNFDMRADDSGRPHFMECNTRYWGTLNLAGAAGANFVELAARAALGERIPFRPPLQDCVLMTLDAAVRRLRLPSDWLSLSPPARQALLQEAADLGALTSRAQASLGRRLGRRNRRRQPAILLRPAG